MEQNLGELFLAPGAETRPLLSRLSQPDGCNRTGRSAATFSIIHATLPLPVAPNLPPPVSVTRSVVKLDGPEVWTGPPGVPRRYGTA